MRLLNKRMIAGVVVLILIILTVATLLPAKTLVTCIDAERINETPYADAYKELQSQNTVNDTIVYGDLWVIESTSLFGRKQETVLTPCVYFAPDDIGTAGTSTWITRFELLSNRNIKANDIKVQITSDTNTGLYFPGFTDGYASKIAPEIKQENNLYSASVSASTVDSSIEPNKDCNAQVFWTSTVSIFGTRTSCQVTIDYEAAYRNNVK